MAVLEQYPVLAGCLSASERLQRVAAYLRHSLPIRRIAIACASVVKIDLYEVREPSVASPISGFVFEFGANRTPARAWLCGFHLPPIGRSLAHPRWTNEPLGQVGAPKSPRYPEMCTRDE